MFNIAIDGPSGAGKSTIAKYLAKKLNILYLDTGAMYRALGLKALKENLDLSNAKQIQTLLNTTDINIVYTDGEQRVLLDNVDVTDSIRLHNVSKMASDISALPPVRINMANRQKQIASLQSSVLDGRDIGTYVLPNAKYKFFLDASIQVRAKRRFDELTAKGQNVEFPKVLQDIEQRDYNDSHRDFAPLKQAADAIKIDTSKLSIEEVISHILTYIKE